MDHEDVKEVIGDIGSKVGKRLPPAIGSDRRSLVTVRDLAEYVAQLPGNADRPSQQEGASENRPVRDDAG
jgi:hypothetical protein